MRASPDSVLKWGKIAFFAFAFVFLLVVVTKRLRANKAPEKIDYIPGGYVGRFDPTALNNSIDKDNTGLFGFFDSDIYEPILNLTDNQLIATVNDWNRRFYGKHQKTLRQIVNDQPWGVFGYLSPTRDAINAKFNNLNIQ